MTGLRVWLQPFFPDENQSLVVRLWSLAKSSCIIFANGQ